MRRLRALLLAAATAVVPLHAPASAADPTVLVAARYDGALVRITLAHRMATVAVLVPARAGTYRVPIQANGTTVSMVTAVDDDRDGRYDVGTVDERTGAVRMFTRDGRSGHVLVSRDGRYRYVLKTNSGGNLVSLVRADARTNKTKTLLAAPPRAAAERGDVRLSGSGISADSRTVYVARTAGDDPSQLLAVDATTGARRVVRPDVAFPGEIFNVVASPDGRLLGVTYLDTRSGALGVRLLPIASGPARDLDAMTDLVASAFTPDSSGVLLSAPLGTLVDGLPGTDLSIGDVQTGAVLPILGTQGLFHAIPIR